MSKSKHTAGPWIFWETEFSDILIYGKLGDGCRDGIVKAKITFDHQDREERIANARLIAAAPEMLEALIEYYRSEVCGDCFPNDCPIINCACLTFKSIIEKATGLSIDEVLEG